MRRREDSPRRRLRTPPEDEPEDGELSDTPGPSSPGKERKKAYSDSSDSPRGFSKIPLPFKSRSKQDSGRPTGRARVPQSYNPPLHYSTQNTYDRWPPESHIAYYPQDRGYPPPRDQDYRDPRYEHNQYASDNYRPRYDEPVEYGRRGADTYASGADTYRPDDTDERHTRKRSRTRSVSRSPTRHLHRLPKRPSPSPPRWRREDRHRPRSPGVLSGSNERHSRQPDSPRSYERRSQLSHSPSRVDGISNDAGPSSMSIDQPSEFLPRTGGKFRINTKPRASVSGELSRIDPEINVLEPQLPSRPSENVLENSGETLTNGALSSQPAVPLPIVPAPNLNHTALETDQSNGDGEHPPATQTVGPSGGVKPLKANGTKVMRPPELEQVAYGRTFVGVDKLADFELLNKLGEGTFGEVHKARRKQTGQFVALKRILMKNETEGVPITALREIRILKQLKHPSVVPIVSMIVQRQQRAAETFIYMVFPYMDHDLSGLLENPNVKLTQSQIKLYTKQLCDGVGYLHRNKILHRDLKSANLLINNEGCLQIADFGLARPVEYISHSSRSFDREREGRSYTNSVVTRWYRSPELLLGSRKYEGWVDMWGVGCIFAEMFQRKPVLPGSSDSDQLTKIFQLCGSPNEDNFPGWNHYDSKQEFVANWAPSSRRIRSVLLDDATPETVDFLDRLLTLDPKRRITAYESLDHDYFWTEPMPADPKSLPKYDDSHEFNRRRVHQPNAPQHVGLPVSHMNQGSQFYGQQQHQPQYYPQPNGRGMVQQPWQNGGGYRGGQPPLQRQQPYNGPPPATILPPIHLVPGRPPPAMYSGPLPAPTGRPSSGGWEPRPEMERSRQKRPDWDRDDRDRRRPRTPAQENPLNYD